MVVITFKIMYNEATKKSQGDESRELNHKPIILSQPGDPRCPVNSFKLYLSKIAGNKIEDFLQTPNSNFRNTNDKWFKNSPVGINTIGSFMSEISKRAGLSFRYMNLCIGCTTASAMKRCGYNLSDIAHVTGHKNIESLKYYLEKPTMQDKENYSSDLFKYAGTDNTNNTTNDSDMSDFETPPPTPPAKRQKKTTPTTNKKKPISTVSCPNNQQLMPHQPQMDIGNTNNSPPSTQNNIMQMYKQNPIGMFVGANISNCTIKINLPK